MAVFGGFETVQEIGADALGVVYSAHREGDDRAKPPEFAVKVRRPLKDGSDVIDSPGIGPEKPAGGSVRDFLASVEAQKQIAIAAGPAGGWAGVYESGRTGEGGAFAVTDLASIGTALHLSRGRVPFDGRGLANVVGQVVRALSAAESGSKRGHGNLRPSNVLITGERELERARVLLADPLPATRAELAADRRADLRAVGELIVLLVTHEPFRGGWPVVDGSEWAGLGRSRTAWIELVNRLLDPSDKASLPDLAEIEATVERLRPKGPKHRGLVIGGAAAALIVVAVIVGLVLAGRSGRAKVDVTKRTLWTPATQAQYAAAWTKYCEEFNWLEPFKRRLPEPIKGAWAGGRKRAEVYAESGLDVEQVLKQIAEAHVEPYNIDATDSGRSFKQRAETGPSNERVVSDDGVRLTAQGLELIGRVRSALTETWPARQRLGAATSEFQGRGWDPASKAMDGLLEGLAPQPQRDMVATVDSAIATDRKLRPIAEAWAGVNSMSEKLDSRGDKVLAAFGEFAPKIVAERLAGQAGPGMDGVLDGVSKGVGDAADLGGKLVAQSEPKALDLESLLESDEYKALAARVDGVKGPVPPDTFRDWLSLAKQHPPITDPDPRETWKASETLAALASETERLDRPPVPVRLEEADGAMLASAQSDAARIGALRWGRRNQSAIVSGDASLHERAKALAEAVRVKREARADLIARGKAAVFDALAAPTKLGPGMGAVERIVDSWHAALRGKVNDDNFPDVRGQFDALDKAVRDAIGQFVSPGTDNAEGAKPAWQDELSKVVAAKVEQRLADAFRALPQPPELDALRQSAATATESQRAFAGDVRSVETRLLTVERAMNDGFVLAGEAPRAKEAGTSLAEAAKSPAWSDAQVQAAIAPLVRRVDSGRAIGGKTDAEELLGVIDAAKAVAPEQVFAGIARLTTITPPWPSTQPHLERAKTLRDAANAAISRVPDKQRKDQVSAEVASAISKIWTNFASRASNPQLMEAALDSIDTFGVAPDSIDQRLKYNLLLRRIRKDALGPEPKPDAAVSAALKSFVGQAGPLGADKSLVARLTEIADNKEPPFDPAKAGPGVAGWTPQSIENDRRLKYSPRAGAARSGAGATLDFIRLGESPKDAVYLGETEVSFAQFISIIAAGGDWGAVGSMVAPAPDAAPDDSPPARVWRWNANAMALAEAWVPDNAVVGQGKGQPIGLYPPALSVEQPKPDHPMQSISPAAALYAARRVNCRFPTADEWKKAFDTLVRQKPPAALLRGQAFNAEVDFLTSAVRQRGVNEVFLPWPDKGIFAQSSRNSQASKGDSPSTVLWFGVVGSDGGAAPIHHLVGNVAEYVFPDKARLEALSATDREIRKLIDDAGGQIKAIGGSSLSPPGLPFNVEQELADGPADEGYTDVGFRLAFSASGRRSLYDQARDELDKAPYLLAGK